MERTMLIIVDMLNDFIDPKGVLFCGESAQAIVPYVRKRLDAYRGADHPVIFLQDAHASDDKEFEKFPPHCVAGTWGSEIISALAPQVGERVIPKTRYSGFFGTPLDHILSEVQPHLVEVVGVCTSICVMDTVGGLVNRDFNVKVPHQGVADFDPEAHNQALRRMDKIYGALIV